MFSSDEWDALIKRAIAQTEAEQLVWASEDTIFSAAVGKYEFVVGSVDNDGRLPYFFGVWNPAVEEYVDKIESRPTAGMATDLESGLSASELIPRVVELARRSASGAVHVFSELLDGLDRLDIRD
ncbi:hypothetical protein ACFSWE_05000 [Leucobacter albus]|uniref:DUF2750 domain-containing protein n=1 Tax=Leucobacter albus TaxID=272210 RepID=A0ABW3TJS9_9MICO